MSVLGNRANHELLRQLASSDGYALIDLAARGETHRAELLAHDYDAVQLNPEGEHRKAAFIGEELMRLGLLSSDEQHSSSATAGSADPTGHRGEDRRPADRDPPPRIRSSSLAPDSTTRIESAAALPYMALRPTGASPSPPFFGARIEETDRVL